VPDHSLKNDEPGADLTVRNPDAAPAPRRTRRSPASLREFALVAVLYACYDAVHALIRGEAPEAVRHARDLLHLEHLLAIDIEHPVNNVLEQAVPIAVAACFFYASAHFIVTPAVLVWMWLRHAGHYTATRTVLAAVTVLALLGFWLFPTAPPRLVPGAGFHDTLADYSTWGWWAATDSAPKPLAAVANQFAAFPSLHVAWSLWCGVTLWRYARQPAVRALGAAYPLITALVVVGTANHFALDVLSGAGLWFVCDRTVRQLTTLRRRRQPVGPGPTEVNLR
jgi:hypothetical protein